LKDNTIARSVVKLEGGENVKDLKEKVFDVSSYLQRLMERDVFPEVVEAVGKSDKELLIRTCRKADVPDVYTGSIASLILTLSRQIKYPSVL